MIILIPKQTHNIYSTFVPKVSLSLVSFILCVCVCVCVGNWFFVPHVSDGGYVPFFGFPFTDNPGRPPTSSNVLRTRRAQPKPPQIHSSALEPRYLSCTLSLSVFFFSFFNFLRNDPVRAYLLFRAAQLHLCADGGANRVYDEMPLLFPQEDPSHVRTRSFSSLIYIFFSIDLISGF